MTHVRLQPAGASPPPDFAIPAPGSLPLSLLSTLELIQPVPGPQDPASGDVDVVVIGAGPVGLTAANLLGARGVRCMLVEQNTSTSATPKAIAIDDEYMRSLDMLGLASTLGPHISAPFGVHFMSPFGFALVKVPGFVTPNGFGNRSAVLQPVFERALLKGCRRFPSVSVHFAQTVSAISQDAACVRMTLHSDAGSREVTARYVLACDGARSPVRTALDIPFPGTRIDEPHLVVDLADFPDQVTHSRFFCNPARPCNSVPAPYGGRRIEFMLSAKDDHAHIVTDQGIRELVDRHTPYKGVPLHIIRRAIYGFSERIADRLAHGRVFLLGDAAHVMPPFGGQGMNTGARDAANLCWKVAAVLDGQASSRILQSYDQERRGHIRATVGYSVRVGRLANIRSRWLGAVRDAAFGLANLLPSVRRYFQQMRHVPRPFISEGLVLREAAADGLTGRLLPRLALTGADGSATSIDAAAGSWFALIGLDVDGDDLAAAQCHPLWQRLRPSLLAIGAAPPSGQMRRGHLEVSDALGRALLATHRGQVIVLRPDRVVAGFAAPGQFRALSDRLETLFGREEIIELDAARVRQTA